MEITDRRTIREANRVGRLVSPRFVIQFDREQAQTEVQEWMVRRVGTGNLEIEVNYTYAKDCQTDDYRQ